MADRDEIKRKLQEFEPHEAAALALRAAMRVFPVLAVRTKTERGRFSYWVGADRSRHVLAILRCYQVATFGSGLPKVDAADTSDVAYAAARAADEVARADAAYAAARAAVYAARTGSADATAAAARAYSAIARADAAFAAALDSDLTFFRHDRDMKALLSCPLWPDGLPDEIARLWRQMISDLGTLHDNFDVWIVWYQERLDGRPIQWELERKWSLLPYDILRQGPAQINAHLKMLRDEHFETLENNDNDGAVPELPELPDDQEPGFQYQQGDDGRIAPLRSGLASADDAAEIAAMRGIIIKAVDNLIAMTSGSNELGWLTGIASDYKDAITADGPPIDDIYGYGIWLENAYHGVKAQIATGDYPNLAPDAAAAINSVVAIHGPMIASTTRGQVLMARARDFAETQADTAEYRLKAQEFAHAVSTAKDAVTEDAREEIARANDNIDKGPHPDRSTEAARTANSNFLLTAAKMVLAEVEVGAKDGVRSTAKWAVTGTLVAAGYATFNASPAIWAFFVSNLGLLREFAAVAGFENTWLQHFLHWVEAQVTKRKPDSEEPDR